MGLFRKRNKEGEGIEIKYIKRLEEGYFDYFDLYYTMYTTSIRNNEYKKIDNVAISLMNVYNSSKNVDKFYHHQYCLAANNDEKEFLNISKQYVLIGTKLIHEILTVCCEGKKLWKKDATFSKSFITTKLEQFDIMKQDFIEARMLRDTLCNDYIHQLENN